MENSISAKYHSLDLIAYLQDENISFDEFKIFNEKGSSDEPTRALCTLIDRVDVAYAQTEASVRNPTSFIEKTLDLGTFVAGTTMLIRGTMMATPLGTILTTIGGIISAQVLSEWRSDTDNLIGNLEDKVDSGNKKINDSIEKLNTATNDLAESSKRGFENVTQQNNTTQSLVKENATKIDKVGSDILHELTKVETKIDSATNTIVEKISSGIDDVKKQATQNHNTLTKHLDKISIKADYNIELSTEVLGTVKGIEGETKSLGKYMFLQMSVSMQKEVLEKGDLDFVKTLPPEERKKQIRQAEQIINKQAMQSNIQNGLAVAGAMLDLATSMGLPPKQAAFIGQTINLAGNIGNTIVACLAPPNPIGIVTGVFKVIGSIFGFFKKKKEDPTLKALSQIQSSLQAMHNDMIKGFNALQNLAVANQKQLLQYMEYQTQLIQNGFEQLSERLVRIENKQEDILFILMNILDQHKPLFNKYSPILNDYIFEKFGDFAKFVESYPDFTSILPELKKRVADDKETQVYYDYLMAKKQRNDQTTNRYIDFEFGEIYQPMLKIFNTFFSTPEEKNNAISALFFPAKYIGDSLTLMWEVTESQQIGHNNTPRLLEEGSYYHPDSIIFTANLFLQCCVFFDIAKNKDYDPCKDSKEYLEMIQNNTKLLPNRNQERINETQNLLYYTNRAIAQQTLLAGHLLLPPIYYALMEASVNPETQQKIAKLFDNNYLLSTNFANYLLVDLLQINNSQTKTTNLSNYITAYTQKDLQVIKYLNNHQDIQFVLKNNNLCLTFKNVTIACPTPEQVTSQEMIYPNTLYELFLTKQKLEEKLIALQLTTNL